MELQENSIIVSDRLDGVFEVKELQVIAEAVIRHHSPAAIIHIFLSPFIFILFIITPQNYVFLARYRRRKCAKREKSGVNQRNLCGQR